ncbi:MAG TPA: TonB-dependent receptor [Gemmatimonadaceae bacterium]|nr:TonB-dependent receptor [Gemmatimonadaceae bacterium]
MREPAACVILRHNGLTLIAVLALAAAAGAQDTVQTPRRLPPVTVTRDAASGGRSPLELPYAITTTRPDSLAPGLTHMLVDQALAFVPGLTVANRNNPSQDARVSVRGFGARSAFGVRSIRVLRDGMPLTLPDGQTPIDYLDLENVGSVETIRGTASALYGNASGGVIDLRSSPPPSTPLAVQLRSWAGSNGLRRYVGLFGGTVANGRASYTGSIGRTMSDGFRRIGGSDTSQSYARQRITNVFVRASTDIRGTELSLVGLGLDMPVAQNPGALTRVQFDTNPEMADPQSVLKVARKEVHQVQVGLGARRAFRGDGEIVAQAYGGGRSLGNPLTFAIVGIDRRTAGASLRATMALGSTGTVRHRFTAGVDAQRLNDARKNWANCNGVVAVSANCPTLGVERGQLSLSQREIVTSVGPFVRDEMEAGRVRATVGVRADNTSFEVRDAFLTDGRNDSGTRSMRAVSPMVGLAVRVAPNHSAYANVSSAFETPTTTELGNQADGSAGLNRDLRPQYATTYEAGMKGLLRTRVQYDVAIFDTRVRDELISFDIGNGRNAFRNAGRTFRRGVEAAVATELGPVSLATAYTFSHFRFRQFVSGGTNVEGKLIPGIPEHQVQTSATWRLRRGFVVAEWWAKDEVQVNDVNAANTAAPGYAVVNLRIGGNATFGRPWLAPVVGVQNLFDRKYVSSVAINAAGTATSAKFYEPGAGRSFFVGVSAATAPW